MLTIELTANGIVIREGATTIKVEPRTLEEANKTAMILRHAQKHIQTIEFEGGNHRYSRLSARPHATDGRRDR